MSQPLEHASWMAVMLSVAKHYRIDVSSERISVALEWERGAPTSVVLERMAGQIGLNMRFVAFDAKLLDPWRLPLVVEFKDGQVGMMERTDGQGRVSVLMGGDQGLATEYSAQALEERAARVAILRPETSVPDARVDDYIKPYTPNWFWKIALRDWPRYGDIILASLFANLLALSSMLFSMQIYDRVVPAQSESTLWVLFFGVLLAIVFEFILRITRTHVSDVIGKRADLKISDVVFGHALRLRNSVRSKSTGTFISQIRELEQVREVITSVTIGAIADLPFVLLFLCVLWMIGGPLVWVALAALPLLIIPGWLAQRPLARLSREGMREGAIRNAMLVEAVEGIEDIKLLRAEPRFQNQWNQMNAVSADISMKQRFITALLMTWTQELQSLVYVVVLLCGCFLVMRGDMTTGALVGASILSSRMIAPLAQLSSIFARWQQAKVARSSLDELMKRPVDQPERTAMLHRPIIHGQYLLENIEFRYGDKDKNPALTVAMLKIQPGERIGILGRMGAGKSTLLQLLAGMQLPQKGKLLLDGADQTLIDPSDVRRDVGLLNQNARLFYGTIRDNLTLGRPLATDEEMLRALAMSGAAQLVQTQTGGLDYIINEGGVGLSGGQRQALLLARTVIRQPRVLLLDEPTAWFDDLTERQVIAAMTPWLEHRTLVVATHRMAVLQWVDRIVVVDAGRVVMDGPKADVLHRLANPK
jgi:ATP-binding cassette subfamily C protein LapB